MMRELVERGVQPDLLDAPEEELLRRGARAVAWENALAPGECAVAWSAGSSRLLAEVDELAAHSLDRGEMERRRWLEQAPLVLGRTLARRRWLPMLAGEYSLFVAAVAQSPHAAAIQVEREGAD